MGCELQARNRQGKGPEWLREGTGKPGGSGTALILFAFFPLLLAQVTPCSKTILPGSREEECGPETLAQLCPRAQKCPQSCIFVL